MILEDVLQLVGILVSGLLFYSYVYSRLPAGDPQRRAWRPVVLGLAFGGLSVACMMSRIDVADGLFVDARAVPLALITLFEGWPTGLLAALVPAAYRLWIGGSGALAGVVLVFSTVLVAEMVRLWARRDGQAGRRHRLVLSGLVYVVTFLSLSLLGAVGLEGFTRVWLWYLVLLVAGIAFVGRLFQDVVEQRALAAAQQRFRAIMDEASDAIRIVDADTLRIIDANRADCQLSGYSREEMIGRDIREFWPEEPGLRAQREASLEAARAHGSARSFALPYRTRTGEIRHADLTRRIIRYEGRRFEIMIYRDAAERVRAEAAQQEAAALRSATLLARAAAHEINNPLAVIMGYLQLLAGRADSTETSEARWTHQMLDAAGRIRDAVERLNRIIRIESTEPTGGAPPMLDTTTSTAPAEPPAGSTEPAPASRDPRPTPPPR